MPERLGDMLARGERDGLVGRESELAWLAEMLEPDCSRQVSVLRGDPGVGKSALLRVFTAIAAEQGHAVGTDVSDNTELLVLDHAIAATADAVRRLPPGTRVVLAGRLDPDPKWDSGTWTWRAEVRELMPLDRAAGTALAAANGVSGRRGALLAGWAEGLPLALLLGAAHARSDADWTPLVDPDPPALCERLLRLTLGELGTIDRADDLGRRALDGDLTGPLARAVRGTIRANAPELDRELRLKLADQHHADGLAGKARAIPALCTLLDGDSPVAAAFVPGPNPVKIDRVRLGDADVVADWHRAHGREGWWQATAPLFATGAARVARDPANDGLAGYVVALSSDDPPPAAQHDPLLARWLVDTRKRRITALLWRETADLTSAAHPLLGPTGALNVAGFVAAGVEHPRHMYVGLGPAQHESAALLERIGGAHVPRLDATVGELTIATWVVDAGRGGLLGRAYDAVLASAGMATAPDAPRGVVTSDVVREALRRFHEPARLAESPLAVGDTVDQRARSVQQMLRGALASLDKSDRTQLVRHTIEIAYINPEASHREARESIKVAQSTFYRLIATGCAALAAALSDD